MGSETLKAARAAIAACGGSANCEAWAVNQTRDANMLALALAGIEAATQPAAAEAPSDVALAEAILCAESWEPDTRILGNVLAADLATMLKELDMRRNRQPADRAVEALRGLVEAMDDFNQFGDKNAVMRRMARALRAAKEVLRG